MTHERNDGALPVAGYARPADLEAVARNGGASVYLTAGQVEGAVPLVVARADEDFVNRAAVDAMVRRIVGDVNAGAMTHAEAKAAFGQMPARHAAPATVKPEGRDWHSDCRVLMANLDALIDLTGEAPEDDDGFMVDEIRAAIVQSVRACAALTPQSDDELEADASRMAWITHNPGDMASDRVNVLCEGADVIILANVQIETARLIVADHNAALRTHPVGDVWQPAPSIPDDIAAMVQKIGRAEWAATAPATSEDHGKAMQVSVDLTATYFDQDQPQPMQFIALEGTGKVLAYVGTSPNSATITQALVGAWNRLHEETLPAWPGDAMEGGAV